MLWLYFQINTCFLDSTQLCYKWEGKKPFVFRFLKAGTEAACLADPQAAFPPPESALLVLAHACICILNLCLIEAWLNCLSPSLWPWTVPAKEEEARHCNLEVVLSADPDTFQIAHFFSPKIISALPKHTYYHFMFLLKSKNHFLVVDL